MTTTHARPRAGETLPTCMYVRHETATDAHAAHVPPVQARTAALYPQRPRRDGSLEFVALLALVALVFIASIAYVRGTPVKPPAPPAQPAATSTSATG